MSVTTTLRVALLLLAVVAPVPAAEPPKDVEKTSYAAQIAAAAFALELDLTGEARYWLERTPERLRGWEWGYLDRESHHQIALLDEAGAAVLALALAPGGARLAAGTERGEVLIWTLADRRLERRFVAHGFGVRGLAFSPDGRRLATAGGDREDDLKEGGKALRTWDVASGQRLAESVHDVRNLVRVAWRPDGSSVAVSGWDRDPETRFPRGFFLLGDPMDFDAATRHPFSFFVAALAFSPDGRWLAAGDPRGQIAVHDLDGGGEPRVLEIEDSPAFPYVEDLAFSPDGTVLAAAVQDGSLRRWETAGWTTTQTFRPPSRGRATSFNAVAVAAGGRLATGGSDELVRLWEAGTAEPLATLRGHLGAVRALAAAEDGVWSGADDGTVRLWPWDPEEAVLEHDGESIWGFDVSRDGRLAGVSTSAGKVRVWDLASRQALWTRQGHEGETCGVVFTADAGRLVSSANDGKLQVWDVATGEPLAVLEDIDDGRAVALSVSPDGRLLAAGSSSGTAKLWDVATGEQVGSVGGHDGEIWRLVWLPDGRRLVSAGRDGAVQVVAVPSGEVLHRFQAHDTWVHGASLSPDATRLATASADKTIRVWDLASGTRLLELTGHDERVYDVQWSPDGRRLASASNDFTARLWDAETGDPLLQVAFPIQVYRTAWSPDGRTLFAVPMDGRVRVMAGR